MKSFVVLGAVVLLLLVSVAKCESEEEPETFEAVENRAELDGPGEGESTTLRPKRQGFAGNWDIYSGGGGGGPPMAAPAAMAVAGGIPGGPIWPGPIGPGPGWPIPGGPISGGWPSWPGWPDPCQPQYPWCPRCSQANSFTSQFCLNFCFQNKWCFCQY